MGLFDGVLGGIVGGIFDKASADDANANSAKQAQAAMRFEKQQAEANRAFNWDAQIQNQQFNMSEATKARSFSQWMAETNYQRTTQDLRKAGLNPMLAYMQGPSGVSSATAARGSPVGSGSMASGKMGNVQSTVGSYARNAAVSNIEAQNAVLRAQANNINVDSQLKVASAAKVATETQNLSQTFKKMVAETENVMQATKTLATQAARNEAETAVAGVRAKLMEIEQDLVKGRTSEALARARALAVLTRLRELEVPQAESYAEYYKSIIGKAEPYGKAAKSAIETITGAKDAISPAPRTYRRR